MSDTKWAVRVTVNGELALTIEDDCLCGCDPLTEEQEGAIREAAESLLGFLGKPKEKPVAQPPSIPLCERCKARPSVATTRWGLIQRVCQGCANQEMVDFIEENTPRPTGVSCPECGEPYFLQTARVDSCSKCGHSEGY